MSASIHLCARMCGWMFIHNLIDKTVYKYVNPVGYSIVPYLNKQKGKQIIKI